MVTFTATVSAVAGMPSGNVVFKAGTTTMGSVALNNGTAALNYAFSQPGSNRVVAAYQGAGNCQRSFGSVTQVVH